MTSQKIITTIFALLITLSLATSLCLLVIVKNAPRNNESRTETLQDIQTSNRPEEVGREDLPIAERYSGGLLAVVRRSDGGVDEVYSDRGEFVEVNINTGERRSLGQANVEYYGKYVYNDQQIYFMASDSLYVQNLETKQGALIQLSREQSPENGRVSDFLVSDDMIFYLSGACGDGMGCDLLMLNRQTGEERLLQSDLPSGKNSGYRLIDYANDSRQIMLARGSGDAGYIAVGLMRINIDTGKTVEEIYQYNAHCTEEILGEPYCTSETLTENEKYLKNESQFFPEYPTCSLYEVIDDGGDVLAVRNHTVVYRLEGAEFIHCE